MTDPRADLTEAMVPIACQLAGSVRNDPDHVERILNNLTHPQTTALLIVLAAMIDINQPAKELLAWADWAA